MRASIADWEFHRSGPSSDPSTPPKTIAAADVPNNVTVAVTTDKGLCGGINTSICKYTRTSLRMSEGGACVHRLLFGVGCAASAGGWLRVVESERGG